MSTVASKLELHGALRRVAVALFAVGTFACRADFLGPPQDTRFLAILTEFDDVSIAAHSRYTYRITSPNNGIDTALVMAPGDTAVLRVDVGSYSVDVQDIPLNCMVRGSSRRWAKVDERTNTAVVRYAVRCRPLFTVVTRTLGSARDESLVYRVWRSDSVVASGMLAANDSVVLSNLEVADHRVTLHHLEENCIVVSPGGTSQSLPVRAGGGVTARFDIRCSSPASRPRILEVNTSYEAGVNALFFRAVDPNRDIADYFWDLTDCQGNSIRKDGERKMSYLREDRTGGQDTVTVIAAFEVGLPDHEVHGRCVSLRVQDGAYNSSNRMQLPLARRPGAAPEISFFNARLIGQTRLVVELEASDPDGDLVGTFAALRLRDGTLGPQDGDWDIGIYNSVGYLGTNLPDIQFLALPHVEPLDVIGSIVYVIDRMGHFTRMEDRDIFR